MPPAGFLVKKWKKSKLLDLESFILTKNFGILKNTFIFTLKSHLQKKLNYQAMNSIKPKVAFIALFALLLIGNTSLSQPPSGATYTAAGAHTYTIPTGYTATIKVEAWGGGGGGGGAANAAGGGGGGGGYASTTYTLPAGTYSVYVGEGGLGAKPNNGAVYSPATGGNASAFKLLPPLQSTVAYGGGPGGTMVYSAPPTPGAGGAGGSSNMGTITKNGGNGGLSGSSVTASTSGGGGGGSATAMANGGNGGDGSFGGVVVPGGTGGDGEGDGGKGGDGGSSPSNGANGTAPGGGGGGKPSFDVNSLPSFSGDGADGQVIITVDSYLPVHFGPFAAELANNTLTVSFTTLQETNNDHFNLQSSQNGVDFTTIATIQSKHADGNASGSTAYHLSLDIAGKISFAVSLFALLGIGVLGFNRKTKVLMAALFLMGVAGFIVSCTKNTNELATGETGKAFLRIEQVDKNGHSTYSKVITITNE